MTLIRSRKRRACGQSLPCYTANVLRAGRVSLYIVVSRSSKWLKPLRSRRKPVPACDTCASRSRSCRSRAQQPRRSSRLRLLNPQRTGSDFLAARERGDEEGRTPASGAGAHPPDEKSLRQNSFVKWTRSQTSPNHKSDLPTVVVMAPLSHDGTLSTINTHNT